MLKDSMYGNGTFVADSTIRAQRRAHKLGHLPPWLTHEQHLEMNKIYIEARRISLDTGIPHEVDHVVPLQGKLVSGLHVPWNLEIVHWQSNRRKINKF